MILSDEDTADLYQAVLTGLRDYVNKNGFPGVLLGLSGGIDSALVAVLAVDALGAAGVRAVMLPSPYTSDGSLRDAAELAARLGIQYDVMPIDAAMQAVSATLTPALGRVPQGLTAENLQSRLRGVLLMALSNATGALLLTTGNKSELAVGYATLYGDMCGGYNPLKDLYKQQVYILSRWRNRQGEVIPENILTRAPSAELRPDQKDSDSLPDYPVLDAILEQLIELNQSIEQVVAKGHDPATVQRVANLLQRAEFKRRQAAPGVKLSGKAFGRDWRLPVTATSTKLID